jgi:3-oxoacyl-[acyl-carrier protein] reductase
MNLGIKNHLFIVGGATSGLGKAVAEVLVAEGATIIAVARGEEKLKEFQSIAPAQIEIVAGDISQSEIIKKVVTQAGDRPLQGVLVNAGGPPAKTVLETTLEDWDAAYKNLLRWKVELTQTVVPKMIKARYGRIVFVESASVKQPMENLVLSTSLRLAVVGFAKTFSQEIAKTGVTLNVLAPGAHDSPAIRRIHVKRSEQTGIPIEEIRKQGIESIPVGALGDPADFASLAVWLLSPVSGYITGQTISVDGGALHTIFG